MIDYFPISDLEISSTIVKKLHDHGWTNTGEMIPKDQSFFCKLLTREEFVELAMAIARYEAGKIWDKEQEQRNGRQIKDRMD